MAYDKCVTTQMNERIYLLGINDVMVERVNRGFCGVDRPVYSVIMVKW